MFFVAWNHKTGAPIGHRPVEVAQQVKVGVHDHIPW